MSVSQTPSAWQKEAERVLISVLRSVRTVSKVKKGAPPWRASVRLVGSAAMKKLNSKYRRKNYATDVLSFEAPEVFKRQGILGELVICLPTLKRQAREQKLDPNDELRILTVHGVLHLLGFDHEKSPVDARKMEKWEKKLLPARIARSGLIKRVESGNS